MEEWGYAGSWFNQLNKVKTVPRICSNNVTVTVTDYSNRCLVFLIETEYAKIPQAKVLGNNQNVFSTEQKSRDYLFLVLMRQMTVLLDVLRPYSFILDFSSQNVSWIVGGCFEVDESFAMVFRYEDEFSPFLQNSVVHSDLTDSEYLLLTQLLRIKTPILITPIQKGISPLRRVPLTSYNPGIPENQLSFSCSLHLNESFSGERVVVVVQSLVDRFMEKQPPHSNPPVLPQSLYVSMRTKIDWVMRDEISGRELRSRRYILSRPVDYWIPYPQRVNETVEMKMNTTGVAALCKDNQSISITNHSDLDISSTSFLLRRNWSNRSKKLSIPFIILLLLCWISVCCSIVIIYLSSFRVS